MNERFLGMTAGVIVGIALVFLIFRVLLKRKNITTEYDERQTLIIGKAYKYGLIGMAVYEGFLMILSVLEISLPVIDPVIHFSAIVIGVMVFACYAVWNGAYFGISSEAQYRTYIKLIIVIGLINFVSAGSAIASGSMIADGKLQTPFINLLCGIMMVTIPVLSYIRSRTQDEEEEQ